MSTKTGDLGSPENNSTKSTENAKNDRAVKNDNIDVNNKYNLSDIGPYFVYVQSKENSQRLFPLRVGHYLFSNDIFKKSVENIQSLGFSRVKVILKSANAANLLVNHEILTAQNLISYIPKYFTQKKGVIRMVDTFFDDDYIMNNIQSDRKVIEIKRMHRRVTDNGEIKTVRRQMEMDISSNRNKIIDIESLTGRLRILKNEAAVKRKEKEKAKYEEKKRREKQRYYKKKQAQLAIQKGSKITKKIATKINKAVSTEEKRRKEREKKRRQRQKLKENKEKHEEYCKKERENYQKKKSLGKIKLIAEMNKREQRLQRKQWRMRQHKRRMKLKNVENFLSYNSPPESRAVTPDNQRPESPVVLDLSVNEGLNQIPGLEKSDQRKTHKRTPKEALSNTENTKLTNKLKQAERLLNETQHKLNIAKAKAERYKKQLQREHRKLLRKSSTTPTLNTKVDGIIQRGDTKEIKKQLLFGEVLQEQIKSNLQSCSTEIEKQIASKIISGRVAKKYRVAGKMNSLISNHRYNRSLRQTEIMPSRKIRMEEYAQKIKKLIFDFFVSDEVSVQTPGKKDCITVRQQKMQKRFLNDTLTNLYKKFITKHQKNDHNHEGNPQKFESFKIINAIKSDATTSRDASRAIISRQCSEGGEVICASLPTVSGLGQCVRRTRQQKNKGISVPSTIEDLNVPEGLTKTKKAKKPSIWKFLEGIQNEQGLTEMKISLRMWRNNFKAKKGRKSFRKVKDACKQLSRQLSK
ncbi:unnamed protein product [Brassicogethes aeneus]|uniref:Uncharacterized protein n=1 Tax=Brassicogethes aeneus TaxID=1431903 RepID=A0A9P0B7A9_BRAAE|nr:unnamed protein product [Brassicogethes aeneus]